MNRMRINQALNDISDELNVPDSVLRKAITSYEGLGEYINNNTEYDVKIFPQGSIRLGTMIRPINDEDDYDIDLVCFVNKRQTNLYRADRRLFYKYSLLFLLYQSYYCG